MRGTYITAIVIAVLTALWLGSGQFLGEPTVESHPTLAELNEKNAAALQDKDPTKVRARVVHSSVQTRSVRVRGRTENKRTVQVRAETVGRVIERTVERGDRVSEGTVLCKLSMEDRAARVVQAREAVNQARIDYQGKLKLQTRGFQSENAIATAKAQLASAQAQLTAAELDRDRTTVRAPFDGQIEMTHAEIGDYLQPGAPCATVVDMDPMLLVGRVSEKDVHRFAIGTTAIGRLSSGKHVSGPVTFIGQQADDVTRTYRIEVNVPNSDYAVRSGITTEIHVPVDTVRAHKVSPALFALDDTGAIGVRTLDHDNRVVFNYVDVVRDDPDGVWVTGLPVTATVITVGQELVVPGEKVSVIFEEPESTPDPQIGTELAPREAEPAEPADKVQAITAT